MYIYHRAEPFANRKASFFFFFAQHLHFEAQEPFRYLVFYGLPGRLLILHFVYKGEGSWRG